MAACGGSEEPGSAPAEAASSTPAPPAPPAPTAAEKAPAAAPETAAADAAASEITPGAKLTAIEEFIPVAAEVDGPTEYEEGVEQPLVAEFPEEQAPEVPRPEIENLPSDDELLGKPLVINDEVIPFDEIKKQVCLAGSGAAEIEQQKLRIFVEEEKKRRTEAGQDAGVVQDDDVQGFVSELEAELQREYPGGEVGLDDLLAGLSSEDPMGNLRLQVQFEKLFLPDNPDDFPPLTLEALLKQPGGEGLLEHYKASYAARQAAGDASAKKDVADRQFDTALLQQIHQHLLEVATIVPHPEPGVLLRVNGVDIRMEDVWERIRPLVTTMEVRAAKQWIVNTRLLRAAFEKAGAWLSDEEAAAAYAAHSDPYKDSIFSQERIALVVKQFPSVDRYKEYRRLYESFQRFEKPTEEQLKAHAEHRTDKIIGQVAVDVDVLLCSAFDFKANRWKPNGWSEAEKRMKDVLRLLVDEQRPWDELVERYSDFYEPPVGVSQQPDPMQPEKGRFRNIQRNNLLPSLGESEYVLFLNGSSVTDFIFFEQEVQSLGDPIRGPVGWYLPRLMRRTKPPPRLTIDPEAHKALILDDYTTTKLNALAQQLIQENRVYGLEYPEDVVAVSESASAK